MAAKPECLPRRELYYHIDRLPRDDRLLIAVDTLRALATTEEAIVDDLDHLLLAAACDAETARQRMLLPLANVKHEDQYNADA